MVGDLAGHGGLYPGRAALKVGVGIEVRDLCGGDSLNGDDGVRCPIDVIDIYVKVEVRSGGIFS